MASAKRQLVERVEPVRVGIIGCGTISAVYLRVLASFPIVQVVACADLVRERAASRAEEFSVPRVCSPEELLRDTEIEVVLNLTVPQSHAAIARAALASGKHIYNEKPLALDRDEGRQLRALAQAQSLRIGCAPDTFLGAGLQTVRKLLDDGWIGAPVAATANLMSHGPEHWHPDPAFLYQPGAGPLFDMGPYYLTSLMTLLGPVLRVTGASKTSFAQRTITSEPLYGTVFDVTTPTHVTALLEFADGVLATLVTSFDVWSASEPRLIEIYGTEGTLRLPDPNTFGGPVLVKRGRAETWSELPLTHNYTENSRGLGLVDMAYAIRSGRAHRANGELALHVLDVMHSIGESAQSGNRSEPKTACERPTPLPLGLLPGTLDH